MKAKEFSGMKTFQARVKLPDKHNTTVIDTQVVARNYELAKRLLKAQYGANSLVSAVHEVK
jgi:hypothetical protein